MEAVLSYMNGWGHCLLVQCISGQQADSFNQIATLWDTVYTYRAHTHYIVTVLVVCSLVQCIVNDDIELTQWICVIYSEIRKSLLCKFCHSQLVLTSWL